MSEVELNIESAIQDFILDSQICLDVSESFVREIFTAGAKWQRLQLRQQLEAAQEKIKSVQADRDDFKMLCDEQEAIIKKAQEQNSYSTDQYLQVDKSIVPVAYYLPANNGYPERISLNEKTARHWSSHMAVKIVEMVPYAHHPIPADHSDFIKWPSGFDIEDMKGVAEGLLDGYEQRIGVGNVTGCGEEYVDSTTAWASKFITAIITSQSEVKPS